MIPAEDLDVVLVVEPGTPRKDVDDAFRAVGAVPDPAVASGPAFAGWLLHGLLPATLQVWPMAGVFALEVGLWPPAVRDGLQQRLKLVDPRRAAELLSAPHPRYLMLGARLAQATGQVDLHPGVRKAGKRILPRDILDALRTIEGELKRGQRARKRLQKDIATLEAVLRASLDGRGPPLRLADDQDVDALFVLEFLPGRPTPPEAPATRPPLDDHWLLAPAGLLRRPTPMGPPVGLPWRDIAGVLAPERVWAVPTRESGPALAWMHDTWVEWPTPWRSIPQPIGAVPLAHDG